MGSSRPGPVDPTLPAAEPSDGTMGSGSTAVAPVSHPDGKPSDILDALPVVAIEAYLVIAEHARGGLGRVMRAKDRLGRPVALKELLEHDEDAKARFLREALVTARLQHPGIVPVY